MVKIIQKQISDPGITQSDNWSLKRSNEIEDLTVINDESNKHFQAELLKLKMFKYEINKSSGRF